MPRKKLLAVSGQSEGGETEAVRDEEGRLVNIPYPKIQQQKEVGPPPKKITIHFCGQLSGQLGDYF